MWEIIWKGEYSLYIQENNSLKGEEHKCKQCDKSFGNQKDHKDGTVGLGVCLEIKSLLSMCLGVVTVFCTVSSSFWTWIIFVFWFNKFPYSFIQHRKPWRKDGGWCWVGLCPKGWLRARVTQIGTSITW